MRLIRESEVREREKKPGELLVVRTKRKPGEL